MNYQLLMINDDVTTTEHSPVKNLQITYEFTNFSIRRFVDSRVIKVP